MVVCRARRVGVTKRDTANCRQPGWDSLGSVDLLTVNGVNYSFLVWLDGSTRPLAQDLSLLTTIF